MLKKISIMAFAAMTAMSPIASYAASGDDVDDLRADSKRKNEWIQVKKDRLKKNYDMGETGRRQNNSLI